MPERLFNFNVALSPITKILFPVLFFCAACGFAQDTVKVALSLTPDQQAELDYNNGLEAMKKNNFEGAVSMFSSCIAVKTTLDKAYANRAVAFTHLKKYPEAISDINTAISIHPQNPVFYYNKSLIFFAQNNKDSQDVALDKCLALDANHADATYHKGMRCYERKEFNRAVGYYNVAIQTRPDFVFAYNDRGSAKRARADYEGAIADYEMAISLDTSLVFVHNNLGSVCRESGRLQRAVDAYSRAYRIRPNYLIALINRGCAYFEMENFKAAQADFEEVLFNDPNNSQAYNNLCSIALKSKDYKRAKDLATRAIELNPKNGPAFYNRGIALQMLKEEDACCADWKNAYRLGVEGAKAFINTTCGD